MGAYQIVAGSQMWTGCRQQSVERSARGAAQGKDPASTNLITFFKLGIWPERIAYSLGNASRIRSGSHHVFARERVAYSLGNASRIRSGTHRVFARERVAYIYNCYNSGISSCANLIKK